jgi:hypothetical protein
MEVMQARYGNAGTVVQAGLMSKFDALVEILKYQPDTAREMASRAKMQAIEDMKIQVMGQNPEMLGVGQPGGQDQEMGGEAGGPNPMLGGDQGGGDQGQPPGGQAPPGGDQGGGNQGQPPPGGQAPAPSGGQEQEDKSGPAGKKGRSEGKPLPEPTQELIKKYDLDIRDFSKEKDEEELDQVELGEE